MKKAFIRMAAFTLVFALLGITGLTMAGCGSPTQQKAEDSNGRIGGDIGFDYGDIAVTGSDGINIISKGNNGSLMFSIEGFTDVSWYVDGSFACAGSEITIKAADFNLGSHTASFVGMKGGISYSQEVPFKVEA